MIDLHCHILPGLDDGPSGMDESLAMARLFVKDGVTHVFATPHYHEHTRNLRAEILPRVLQLNEELRRISLPLTVLPGSEIQVTDSESFRQMFETGFFCHLGKKSSYTLIEFSWNRTNFPPDAAELIKWLLERKITPIIAHPERQIYLEEEGSLQDLSAAGAWLQISVDSLLGRHGPVAMEAAERMLRKFSLTVLATDSHSLRRCPPLSLGYKWVNDSISPELAAELASRARIILTASS